jgi:RNA recognition motif-containing protein
LSFDATTGELEALFADVGEVVEVFVPTDRNTGRPRGFAFVEFTDRASVSAAIEKFNDFEFRGRRLRVNEAEARRPRRPSFSEGGYGYGPAPKPWEGKSKGSRRNLRRRKRGF